MILLALLPLLLSLAFADQGCPPGASISLKGDKCYQTVPTLVDFHTAEKVCVEFGGHLASVHNKWDNAALTESDQVGNYWLGGQDINNDASWTWTDGSAFNYNNWASGGAMNGKDCLLLDSPTGLWESADCAHQANFICETNVPATTASTSDCPFGELCMDGHYYHLDESKVSWNDALSRCQKNGGSLASVHTVRVEKLLEQLMSGTTAFWIGGKVDFGNLNWSDGTSVNYTNWLPGQTPTAGETEGCVWMRATDTSIGWQTYPCSDTGPFMCAYPL
uniref:C-type lectin domain-containing protein n=1 Tax=Steinernema glaseri TaxID=37863 RepID=A0A1I7YRT6_9BILA